jgi:acetylornithine/succinyldiaminopimelate/putrescine aminotransferase
MAAVKAVLGVVKDPTFLEEVRFKGAVLKNALQKLAQRIPGAEVRGEGLLLGFDLGDADLAREFFERCLEEGVLVNLVGGTTIRLAPPLTVTRTEVRAALDTFRGGVYAALSAAEVAEMPAAAVA